MDGLPTSPSSRRTSGAGPGRCSPNPGNRTGVSALCVVGDILAGLGTSRAGQSEAGLAKMHQSMTAVSATGYMLARPLWLVRLAEVVEHAGEVTEGFDTADRQEAKALLEVLSCP